jgi:hypothetical protein
LGDRLLEQGELFPGHLGQHGGRSGDVLARAREAGDEPAPQRIAHAHHDDGSRPGRTLGGQGGLRHDRDDDVDLEPDQLHREVGEPLEPPLRPSGLEGDVLSLHPGELTERVAEGREEGRIRRGRAGR